MADRWKTEGRELSTIVSGSLARARRTTEIIAEVLSVPPVPVTADDKWMEIDAGGLTGLPKSEGIKRFPSMNSFHGPYDRIANGTGESESQIHARALYALESLVNDFSGDCLVVSHGGFLNAVAHMAFGIPIPVNRNGVLFRFRDTGYMDLAYNKEIHRWIVFGFVNG